MPVTSTRRISTSSTTGLPPFSGSTLSTSSYRRSTALSPSRFLSPSSSTSTSGLGIGYYRSLSSSSNYLSNRNSVAGYPSNESSYVSSRYSSTLSSSSKPSAGASGDSGYGSSERARGSGLLGSRASIARSVALSGADLYAKYSPANYVPNSELSRSRSLTDANRDRQSRINITTTTTPSSTHLNAKSSDYDANLLCPSSAYTRKKLDALNSNTSNNTIKSSPSPTSSSSIGASAAAATKRENRRARVYSSSQDESEDADENNNNSNNTSSSSTKGSGRSSVVRRKGVPPKVALGGAGSALDTVDGEIKVTRGADSVALFAGAGLLDINSPEAALVQRAALLSLSCDETNNNTNNNNNHNNRIPIDKGGKKDLTTIRNGGVTKGRTPPAPSNVTKITINHSAANGTSVILNNGQCTSNNRAIVHIFGNADQQQEDYHHRGRVVVAAEDLRNNNNRNNIRSSSISGRIINHSNNLRPAERSNRSGSIAELNGDLRRQREATQTTNGTRVIQVGGGTGSSSNGTMLLRQQGVTNGTSGGDRVSAYNGGGSGAINGKLKRDPEIFLRDECDLVRNELMQKKIAEHNPEERLNGVNGMSEERGNNLKNSVISSSSNSSGGKTIKVIVGGVAVNGTRGSGEINNNSGLSTKERIEKMENGWKTELEERRSMILQNGGGSAAGYRNCHSGISNGRGSSPMDIDSSEEHSNGGGRDYSTPMSMTNGHGGAVRKKGSNSSHSSNSSSASSLMDSGRSNFEDIKFIDSDDNNEAAAGASGNGIASSAASLGAALNGASSRMSKLNKSLASTLDSLKASTPIVGSGRQYNVTNGHHTLPYHSSSGLMNGTGSANRRLDDHAKKYSTLSNLPSKSAAIIRNGLTNGAAGGSGGLLVEDRKTFHSNDARIMGLIDDREEMKEHELLIKETEMDAMVTSSEPPNDKISGKSWEVNGTNGVRTSSLRNALPPVSPVRTWERDRPRYRELLDAEPSTVSSGSSSSKYDSYEKGSSDTVEGLCGLRNIGNTCFMNSVIQCLSHTNDLTKFLRSQRDPKSTTKDQRIFAEYVKLIKDMWSPNTRTVTPMELKSAVSSKHRMYSGCGQQDAQEFLRFFLEALHGACNEGTKQEGLTLDDNLSDGKRADLMWDWYSKTESSVIKDLFVGQLRSTLRCTVCGNASVTFDPFWDLSVPLPPSSSRCKLENCLELFIREEVLDGDEMPTCSKCKTRRKSTKSFTIQRFPKYLVIHLKRFSETRWSKLTNVVEFPMGDRELNLAPYASNNTAGSPHYSLYGISNHMGSTAGGHYVALCKHPQTRKWHEFNDNHVSDSSESSLISSSAYLLFYERA